MPASDFSLPLKLRPNRIWRPFMGGKLLDRWQGILPGEDGHYPEEWVASTIRSSVKEEDVGAGLSRTVTENRLLVELIDQNPEAMLGRRHIETLGTEPGILFKMLDSATRLLVQGHPDRERAQRLFGSQYGKAEAWYIVDTRSINGEEPYVLMGFKSGITRKRWEALFESQNVAGIIDCLHKVQVEPGDVFFIEGGVPHAMGPGVFFAEIMEPTDLTFRMERLSPDGIRLTDETLHIGAGFEAMFDCFDYDGYSRPAALKRWGRTPAIIERQEASRIEGLLRAEDASYFGMNRLVVADAFSSINNRQNLASRGGRYSVAVVVTGRGSIECGAAALEVSAGDELVFPAAIKKIKWTNYGSEELEIVQVFPPDLEGET